MSKTLPPITFEMRATLETALTALRIVNTCITTLTAHAGLEPHEALGGTLEELDYLLPPKSDPIVVTDQMVRNFIKLTRTTA